MTEKELVHIITQGENETVEFKQSFNKAVIETLVAFSNNRGGKVIIGVDNNRKIKGISITDESVQKWVNEIKQTTSPQIIPDVEIFTIEGIEIVVLSVIEYPIKPVSYKNKYLKRVLNSNHLMNLDEISNLHLQTINSSWDYYPDPNHSLQHISIEKVEKYIKEFEKWNKTQVNFEPLDFLNKLEILRNNKLTFGAYILFAKDLCVVSDIQIGRFKSSTKIIDSLNLDTDIFTELDQILAFIKKHLMVEFIITGNPQREERYDYPVEAIREIVINMLIHRDYRDSSGSIIKIYDDRIEFFNPGGLFGGLSLNDLLQFNYQPKSRNKLISKAFKEVGKIERYGSGIKRIFTICKQYGLVSPDFNITNNSFEVILYKKKTDQKTDQKTDIEKIIEIISQNKHVTIKEIAKSIHKGTTVTKEKLKKLKESGKIKRIGPDKGGYWKVTTNND